MPRFIVKLNTADQDYYLEWSTVVDAPVTYGMSREEFEQYYAQSYGTEGLRDLPGRMARVEAKGTSSRIDDSAEDVISCNRAGKNESNLSVSDIIKYYCVLQQEPQ